MDAETKSRVSIGEFLQQLREKNGFSVEYVADQLNLKLSTVRALEKNCYEQIGGLVYVKGYLRSYARLLHVDIEAQLPDSMGAEVYSAKNTSFDALKQSQITKKNSWAKTFLTKRRMTSLTIVLLLFMIISAVIYFSFYWAHKNNRLSISNSVLSSHLLPKATAYWLHIDNKTNQSQETNKVDSKKLQADAALNQALVTSNLSGSDKETNNEDSSVN